MKWVILFVGLIIAAFVVLFFVIGQYPVLRSGVEVANSTNITLQNNFTGFNAALKSYLWLPVVIVVGWIAYAIWHHVRASDN